MLSRFQAVLLILLFLSVSPQPVAVIETVDAMCLCKFVAPRYSVIARQAFNRPRARIKRRRKPNYNQPNSSNPAPNPAVGILPVYMNALQLGPTPLPVFVEPLTDKDDPHGKLRGHGKS